MYLIFCFKHFIYSAFEERFNTILNEDGVVVEVTFYIEKSGQSVCSLVLLTILSFLIPRIPQISCPLEWLELFPVKREETGFIETF